MMLDAPLAHVIQNGVWMMDDQVYPIAELETYKLMETDITTMTFITL